MRLYTVNGKYVWIERHANDGMNAERPYIKVEHVLETLRDPDKLEKEAGIRKKAIKWIGFRTIIVYYDETEEEIHVTGVSSTRRKLV